MKDYEDGWLNYRPVSKVPDEIKGLVHIYCSVNGDCICNAIKEIDTAFDAMYGKMLSRDLMVNDAKDGIALKLYDADDVQYTGSFIPDEEGYGIYYCGDSNLITICSKSDRGILYGVFRLIRMLMCGQKIKDMCV